MGEQSKRLWGGFFVLAFSSLPWLLNARTEQPSALDDWSHLETGPEVYGAACATCHGAGGTGAPAALVGFDIPLPDFTDCGFSSREPHQDWIGIASEGGPIRGFDTMMPSFSGVLTDKQMGAAVDHIKGFCREKKWPPGELNLPRALVTTKAYPEDEIVWELSSTTREPVSILFAFTAEKRIGARHQIEAKLPVGLQQVAYDSDLQENAYRWGEGMGDIALGWKSVLWHSGRGGSIGSLSGEVIVPTGDEKDELGKGIFVLEPFLAVGQIIPHAGFLQLQAGAELSTDLAYADHEVFWRGVYGVDFSVGKTGRVLAPMVEVLGKVELGDEPEVAWDLVPQLFVTLNQRQHIMLGAGARIPVTDFADRQVEVMTYLLWDWFDGGFTEGW